MALARNHNAVADGTFSATGAVNWNAAHAISGAISGGIPYFDSTTSEGTTALLAANGVILGGGAGAAPSTNANLTYGTSGPSGGITLTVGNGHSATGTGWIMGSYGADYHIGMWDTAVTPTTSNFIFHVVGTGQGVAINDTAEIDLAIATVPKFSVVPTKTWSSCAINGINQGGSTFNAANGYHSIIKAASGIADAVSTSSGITVTVPNAAHSATIRVRYKGSIGAGGAIGANEATGTVGYDISIARTAGLDTVVTYSAALGTAIAGVAGSTVMTITGAASSISGASSATQTFTLNVTISHTLGSSTNHTCNTFAEMVNANSSGVTMA